jgi:hypothetical protein
LATAWPEDFESQSCPKPSQSPGFQAKPGQNITNSTGITPPTITGQLLVDIFVLEEEEIALKFEEEVTDLYRKEYNPRH